MLSYRILRHQHSLTNQRGVAVNKKNETTDTKQRGAAVAELVFAIATLAAAVVVGAMMAQKWPDCGSD
jgi:hypothetical protein